MYDKYKNGSEDPIFVKFARRVLSISANSASCERLFSVYGNILTKHRSRLLVKNLTNNAELKMHIRDEHLRNKEAQLRQKRRFERRTKAELQDAQRLQPTIPVVNNPPTNTQASASTTTHVVESNVPSSEQAGEYYDIFITILVFKVSVHELIINYSYR